MFASGNGVKELPILVKDFDLEIAEDVAAFLVVGYLRLFRTVTAVESFVALGPATEVFEVLHGGPASNQCCLLRHEIGSEGTQRGNIVDDPDAPSMGGDDQIALAGMSHDIVHG